MAALQASASVHEHFCVACFCVRTSFGDSTARPTLTASCQPPTSNPTSPQSNCAETMMTLMLVLPVLHCLVGRDNLIECVATAIPGQVLADTWGMALQVDGTRNSLGPSPAATVTLLAHNLHRVQTDWSSLLCNLLHHCELSN